MNKLIYNGKEYELIPVSAVPTYRFVAKIEEDYSDIAIKRPEERRLILPTLSDQFILWPDYNEWRADTIKLGDKYFGLKLIKKEDV